MNRDLIPVVAPGAQPLLAQLVRTLDELSIFQLAADLSLRELVDESPELKDACEQLAGYNARLLERLITVDRSVTRVDIGGVSSSLRMLIDMTSNTALSLAQEAQLTRLYRKLASKYHPDRFSGNPDLFHVVQRAYKAKNFVVLSVYALSIDSGRSEEEKLTSLLKTAQHDRDVYMSQPSYQVLRLCQIRKRAEAGCLLGRILAQKLLDANSKLLFHIFSGEDQNVADHVTS